MSHQSEWGYYKQPIKLPLVKVNHVCEDFIPILKRPILDFFFFLSHGKHFPHISPYNMSLLLRVSRGILPTRSKLLFTS